LLCSSCGRENDATAATCAACGAPLSAALLATDPATQTAPFANDGTAPLAVGQQISHYRIEGQLGAGGMGVVYRATDVNLRRPAALKLLPPSRAADAAARARFLREARAASALDHPNIGTVYEVGGDGPTPFIAMALYQGETLQQRIARGPLAPDEIARIGAALSDALAAAHAAGIVHRDLKPANVMLTSDGGVKLLDFGLAKLENDDSHSLTRDGALMGTLAYMAPEQLRGEPVDARADLWALGAILFEMATGRRAFAGDTMAVVSTRILHEPPPATPRETPPPIGAIINGLLARTRDERIASASRVAAMLRGNEAAPRDRRRGKLGRWLAAGAGLLLVAAAATIFMAPRKSRREDGAKQLYQAAMSKFGDDKFDEAAALFEEGYRVYHSPQLLYNLGQSYRLGGHPERAVTSYRAFLASNPEPGPRARVEKDLAAALAMLPSPSPSPSEREPSDRLSPQKKRDAHQYYQDANRKFDAHDFAGAGIDFMTAHELSGDSAILFNAANSFQQAHQPVLAISFYRRFLEHTSPGSAGAAAARRQLTKLGARKP
jgi:tetratricopeptide (TPR) repeat protein